MKGKNDAGQCATGSDNSTIIPTPFKVTVSVLTNGNKIVQVVCAMSHCIARDDGGRIYTWGNLII
jgi:alpha-tubulin suppressor-like RCC1 family protein